MRFSVLLGMALGVAAVDYDYVIVGAGTAGLVIANRLSADPKVQILVIDPGNDERKNPNVTIPKNLGNPAGTDIDWQYKTVPQANAFGRVVDVPSGKAWGGSSAINGMTYVRGDAALYNAWEKLGNKGWNWHSMFPYFEKSEKFTHPNKEQISVGASYEPEYHGQKGAVRVGYPPILVENDFGPPIMETWENLGISKNPDLNKGTVPGYAIGPQTLDSKKELRWDAVVSYYSPVEGRKNLKIIKGTVKRITWARKKNKGKTGSCKLAVADGVEYLDKNGKVQTVKAKREVVVSAGTTRTPLVLEGSGVGNPALLKKLGIDTVVDLPGVGENIIEQPGGGLYLPTDIKGAESALHAFATASEIFGDDVDSVAKATRAKISEYAAAIVAASPGSALSASGIEKQLKIQHDLLFKENVAFSEILNVVNPGSSLLFSQFWILFPFARGRVHLGDVEEIDSPQYDPQMFGVDFDMEGLVATGKLTAKYVRTKPLSDHIMDYSAYPENPSDAEWQGFMAQTAGVMIHAVGSSAMMSRELGGVVDSELKVYGTANVRVVDASVIPTQISGHLTAVVYAIAERAAEAIKAAR